MYGVEAAVLALVCGFVIVALWSMPLWMHLVTNFITWLSGRLDRVDSNNEQDRTVFPKEER